MTAMNKAGTETHSLPAKRNKNFYTNIKANTKPVVKWVLDIAHKDTHEQETCEFMHVDAMEEIKGELTPQKIAYHILFEQCGMWNWPEPYGPDNPHHDDYQEWGAAVYWCIDSEHYEVDCHLMVDDIYLGNMDLYNLRTDLNRLLERLEEVSQ